METMVEEKQNRDQKNEWPWRQHRVARAKQQAGSVGSRWGRDHKLRRGGLPDLWDGHNKQART